MNSFNFFKQYYRHIIYERDHIQSLILKKNALYLTLPLMENMIPDDGIIIKNSLKIVLVSMPKSELNCCDLLYSTSVSL